MKSKTITVLAGIIAAVVLASVVIGLSSPDGSVGDDPKASGSPRETSAPQTPSPSGPTSGATPPTAAASARLAPASVRGTWPGRPSTTRRTGSGVDWCPAVRTAGAAEAERVFGTKAVRAAACAAVSFMFEQRYSRLSLPRRSYASSDLDFVLPALTPGTAQVYRPRISRFVADPDSVDARQDLGLVLFRGKGTGGAEHASAGRGRVFYGRAFTTSGYRHRAAWINPTWSRVAVGVDWSTAAPRLLASMTASAAVPVFHPTRQRHEMMTVPTTATLFLRNVDGRTWRISGWSAITTGAPSYARLKVR